MHYWLYTYIYIYTHIYIYTQYICVVNKYVVAHCRTLHDPHTWRNE